MASLWTLLPQERQGREKENTCITTYSTIKLCLMLWRASTSTVQPKINWKISMITEHELPYNSLKTPKAMQVPFICHTALTQGESHFPSLSTMPGCISNLLLSPPLEREADKYWQCFKVLLKNVFLFLYSLYFLDMCTQIQPIISVIDYSHNIKWSSIISEKTRNSLLFWMPSLTYIKLPLIKSEFRLIQMWHVSTAQHCYNYAYI